MKRMEERLQKMVEFIDNHLGQVEKQKIEEVGR
jgi:hypothetical protein